MSEKFSIEIISPDKSILKMETSEVVIPSFEGEMGILKDHIPLITFLRPGIINIKAGTEQKFFVEEGTVEFSNNNLLHATSIGLLGYIFGDKASNTNKNSVNVIDTAPTLISPLRRPLNISIKN